MKEKILLIAAVIVAMSITAIMMIPEESKQVAKFGTVSILSPTQNNADVTLLKLGDQATITVNAEKMTGDTISDIMVKASLTNSENGQYFLINKPTIHAGVQMASEDYLEYDDSEIKTVPFPNGDITEPMVIAVTVIDSPGRDFEETIRVVLFADGVQMDEVTFDIKTASVGI